MNKLRMLQLLPLAVVIPFLSSCDPSQILGDCRITTDNFSSAYGPNEQRTHSFTVGCPGTINLFWTCPQCADPQSGRLLLLNPVGDPTLNLNGAGFQGRRQSVSTVLEGQWTLVLQGTGGNFQNNYSVDVTYPGL